MSARVGGAIVVVAAGRTTSQQLSGALDSLELLNARVMGIVLAMVPTKGPDSYGYGRYGYGYGYGASESGSAKGRDSQRRAASRGATEAAARRGRGVQ